MNQLPEFWRTEVFHPLSVHFPIALLIVATIFKAAALKFKKDLWVQGGSLLLYVGTITAWIAIYTGDLADGIVSRAICDPTILKAHEENAYVMAWLFSAATVIDVILWIRRLPIKKIFLEVAFVLLMLIGSGFLIYVGHLGAELVYQQGAGVYVPSGDCAEFE